MLWLPPSHKTVPLGGLLRRITNNRPVSGDGALLQCSNNTVVQRWWIMIIIIITTTHICIWPHRNTITFWCFKSDVELFIFSKTLNLFNRKLLCFKEPSNHLICGICGHSVTNTDNATESYTTHLQVVTR